MDYLIHPTQRAIVLPNPRDRAQLLATIHTAREVAWQGHAPIVMPYRVWETQMLRSRGIDVPSPIGYFYDWPRDRVLIPQPFHNQIETGAALTLWHRGYCLNEIGTGKTMSAMWAADYLMKAGMIRRVMIHSPLSTITRVWGDAVFAHFRGRSIAILHGSAAKRKKLLEQDHDFYVINHEGLDTICDIERRVIRDRSTGEELGQRVVSVKIPRDDLDLHIVDELAAYRNATTKKWKVLNGLMTPKTWIWGLTGTPMPNEPSDAWAQCKLITPWTVPDYFSTFRQMTMQKMTEHIWIPLPNAHEVVYKAMQPSIRFERDQCFDLPPCTYSNREVELTPTQRKHYKEVEKQLYTEVNGGSVSAVNEGVKAGKLVQIACGMVLDNLGAAHLVDCGPRVDLVEELIREAGHKVIVFVPYHAPLVMLAKELERRGISVAMIHGGVSTGVRNTVFASFQNSRDPRVLVADAGTMSHGLTLTEANTIIWYAPEWSNDTYTQANGRITRAGQKNAQHIIHIAGTAIERRIYARLEQRSKLQGLLLELVRRGEEL